MSGRTIDELAQHIRTVDGNHDLGAGALAEAILPFVTKPLEDEIEELRAQVREYKDALTWDTTCLNCASLLDRNYHDYVRAERAIEALRDVSEQVIQAGHRLYGAVEEASS